jgi:hypothetical protein
MIPVAESTIRISIANAIGWNAVFNKLKQRRRFATR